MNKLIINDFTLPGTFGTFLVWIKETFKKIVDHINSSNNVVVGTYVGDGNSEKFIDLGFTPVAVEIYSPNGIQYSSGDNAPKGGYGGLALQGNDCGFDSTKTIQICNNGFKVFYNSSMNIQTNSGIYYFTAYKYAEVLTIT